MPPKKAQKPQDAGAAAEGQPPPPDPNVLLYFEAASRAFPHVAKFLTERTAAVKGETEQHEKSATALRDVSAAEVLDFAAKRKTLEAEIEALVTTKAALRTSIDEDAKAFSEEFVNLRVEHEQALADMRAELQEWQAKRRQADAWQDEATTRRRELQSLQDTIDQRKKAYEEEYQRMAEKLEADKRKLRDALVRRLRRVRDNLTAEPANDEGGDGPELHQQHGLHGMDPSGAATARINEELSREISVKEREAAAQQAAIRQLEATERERSAALQAEQEANTQLLLRNASYLKTRRALEVKLEELQAQLKQVIGRRDHQQRERLTALRGTVAMQATVIDELNSEIDLHVEDLQRARRRVRASRAARSKTDLKHGSAMKFLWAAAADARAALESNARASLSSSSIRETSTAMVPAPPNAVGGVSSGKSRFVEGEPLVVVEPSGNMARVSSMSEKLSVLLSIMVTDASSQASLASHPS